jgi:signal transduction histidine kinase
MGRASQLAERVEEMLAKSRGMVSSLSPTRLETDGLLPALLDLAKHLQATAHIDCVVEHSGLLPRDYFVSLQLFRIARETVETMVRHTLPEKVRIGVHAQQGLTILRVEAEGSRPLQGSREAAETSLGMLQVQASTIGAALELREKDGLQGVVCRVPTVD